MPVEESDDYIEFRVAAPSAYGKIVGSKWLDEKKSILARIAKKREGSGTLISHILFNKKKGWTESKAKKWLKDHDYTIKSIEARGDHAIPMEYKYLVAPLSKSVEQDSDNKWELIIEAMVSTPDVDRGGDVTLPTAFAKTMPEFMKNPIMFFNHNPMLTVGQVLDYKIGEDGLWIRGGIDGGTQAGKETAHLIRSNIIKSMSFSYRIIEAEAGKDGDPFTIKELEVFEIGPVSIPMNTQALIEAAKAQNIELKSLTSSSEAGGQITEGDHVMEEKEVRDIVTSSVTPVVEDTEKQGVKISEVGKRIDEVVKLQTELKDASDNGKKTTGELRELIDKMTGEFKKAVDGLTTEVTRIQNQKRIDTMEPMATSMKDLIKMEPLEVQRLYPKKAALVNELQKSNDKILILDTLLSAASHTAGGSYHMTPLAERIKSFGELGKFEEFRKALDTATTTEGLELVPTELSGQIKELIRIELKVANLFEELPMPTKSYEVPIETADVLATLQGEKTAIVSTFDSTEQDPLSHKCTLTAKKARARIQVSAELTEDAIFPVIPWLNRHAARAIARSVDRAIVNGDTSTTHFDTGHTVGSSDFRRAWKGLRYHYNTTIKATLGVDISALSEDLLREIRQNMGKHGMYPNDLAWLSSIKGYLGGFLRKLDQVQTLDKYGPKAVILSGELSKVDGIPNIVTEFIEDVLDADGLYTGTGNAASEILLVNRLAWVRGSYRDITLAIVPDQINDVFTVVAFKRCDFQPFWVPSTTEVAVNAGHNLCF